MLHVYRILILAVHFMCVQCLIPDLSVQKIDKRLIARKRQDTLEMCRLFTTETEKIHTNSLDKSFKSKGRNRPKRETATTPTDEEIKKARRVESIVDQLYNDMEENGANITYRRRNLDNFRTTQITKDLNNKTMRRFAFAPAEFLGPWRGKQNSSHNDDHSKEIPGNIYDWPKRWVNGIVPFYIDSKTYDTELADEIQKAFDYFEKATCIRLQRLKDRPTDKNSLQFTQWLYITNPTGIRQCVHSNEKKANKGVQMVVFGYDCMSLGEIVHEIMHVLGFSHEHTRPDRDQYITILWNNIKPGYKKYFELRSDDPLTTIPYDYLSVLHYPPRAFSKNGQVTLLAQPGIKLGQRDGLSEGDVEKISRIYGNECVERNKQYLYKTCPSVVKATPPSHVVTKQEIQDYFKDRVWPYGVINYKLKDKMEFSAEEKENIKAVINHIEKETCIEFRDITTEDDLEPNDDDIHLMKGNKQDPGLMKTNNQSQVVSMEKNSAVDSDHASNNTMPSEADNEINLTDYINNVNNDETSLRQGTNESVKMQKNDTTTQPVNSKRRHAADIFVISRSVEPGCDCPTPGRPNGNKELKINADCFNSVNDLLHLFVHVLGLDHQHNMYDRDSYLHIVWDNLSPDISDEMKEKLPPGASLGFDYDYQSVMHFPWLQIRNGFTNMMYPIWNDGWAMGRWQGLSTTDVFKLNLLYYDECLKRKQES